MEQEVGKDGEGRLSTKRVQVDIGESAFQQLANRPKSVEVPADATVVEVLAELDRRVSKLPVHPRKYHLGARCLLQLVWDPATGEIFEDVGIEARTASHEMIPLREHPATVIPDGSTLFLWPDAGC
ncbi:MAG: hypothetical protein ACTSU5_04385 [Promethearchaeota archaeon]